MKKIDTRYALWGLTLLLFAAVPAFGGFVNITWEICQIAGLAGALACLALCGSPVRPRDSAPPTLMSLRLHSRIGWLALIAVAVHVGGLVLADPTVIEYLKPTAPLYQLAGIAASIVLLVVVVSSIPRVRRALWTSQRNFQAVHIILGCLLAAGIALHVTVTARYVSGYGLRALLLAATIGAMLMLLRRRRPLSATGGAAQKNHQLAFGRHSRSILFAIAIIGAAVAVSAWSGAQGALRKPLAARVHTIPLDFPHGKHVAVNCLTCHHNYADGRGFDRCIGCHQSSRSDLKLGAEVRFHGFCLDCHRHPAAALTRHGPVSGCNVCHRPPNAVQ